MYRCFCGDSQCSECGSLQGTIHVEDDMHIGYQKPDRGLAMLCVAIAYAAFKALGQAEPSGGEIEVAGWKFNRWEIENAEQLLGVKTRVRASIAVDCLIDYWHFAGDRMRKRSVRTDFGALLGKPERVTVDWREIRA